MKKCINCKHFVPYLPNDDGAEEDIFGECRWPNPPLPWSWRYAEREVMGVTAADGGDCQCHQPLERVVESISKPEPGWDERPVEDGCVRGGGTVNGRLDYSPNSGFNVILHSTGSGYGFGVGGPEMKEGRTIDGNEKGQ